MKNSKSYRFIKNFQKIRISHICKELGVDTANVLNDKTSEDNMDKIKEEITDKIARLFLKDEEKWD